MSSNIQNRLRPKLDQLECHFTWGLFGGHTELREVERNLEEDITLESKQKERLAQTYALLSYVKFLRGFIEEAFDIQMKCLNLYTESKRSEIHSNLMVTYGNIAWINYRMSNYKECEIYLEKIQKIKEDSTTGCSSVSAVLGDKAWAYLKFTKNYNVISKEMFKMALELKPDDADLNAGYARALYWTEYDNPSIEVSVPIKQLRKALDLNPDEAVLMCLLIHRLISPYKKFQEAESLVEQVLRIVPEHPRVEWYIYKYVSSPFGCVDKFITFLLKLLKQFPNLGFLHYLLFVLNNKKKAKLGSSQADEAQRIRDDCIIHLEMATNLRSDFFPAMSNLALMYGESGDLLSSEKLFQDSFRAAEEKNESLHVVHYCFAQFHLCSKSSPELAMKHFIECIKTSPSSKLFEVKRSAESVKKYAKTNPQDRREKRESDKAIEWLVEAIENIDGDKFLKNLSETFLKKLS